jgi:hypothetical protein
VELKRKSVSPKKFLNFSIIVSTIDRFLGIFFSSREFGTMFGGVWQQTIIPS